MPRRKRDLLTLWDLSPGELDAALLRAAVLKAARSRHERTHSLPGRTLGMIFEKQGNAAAARREYETGLALEPNNADLKAALQRLGGPR